MKFSLSITGFLLLAGCATGYQAHTWSGGYKDKALGENHYYVEYLGNGTNSTETVNILGYARKGIMSKWLH